VSNVKYILLLYKIKEHKANILLLLLARFCAIFTSKSAVFVGGVAKIFLCLGAGYFS